MTLLLLLLGALQNPSLDDLLKDLSSEKAPIRESATRQISELWTSWSEADLKKIEQAARAGDSETSARVQTILAEIALRRRIPARIVEATPNLLQVLRAGSVEQSVDVIDRLEALRKDGKVSDRDLIPVYIEFLDDRRVTALVVDNFRGLNDEEFLLLGQLARKNLEALILKPQLSGRAAWRAWWEEHWGRPLQEWYLPDLTHPQEEVRVGAIQRLARLKEAAHVPRIFGALRSLRNNLRIATAIDAVQEFPREILLQELRPLLRDPHPYARLWAARLLFAAIPEESVAAVLDAHDKADGLDYEGIDPHGFRSGNVTLAWLSSIRHPKAFEFVLRATKSGNSGLKDQAMWALSRMEGPEALDALAGMLDDSEAQNCSGTIHGAAIDHPRFGDVAGILLATRLQLKEGFNWICSKRERDLNLAIIRNGWRETKGLPALPVPSPKPLPVAREKVAPLLADLVAEDEGRRSKATAALLQLGAGAWAPLKQLIADASGASKERLESAALMFANAVRSVVVQGDAEALASTLRERLQTPLRIEDLEAMGEAWFRDSGLGSIELEIDRDRDGRGISIVVSVRKGQKTTNPDSLGWSSRGSTGAGIATEDVFDDIWRKSFLAPFKATVLLGSSEYAYQWVKIEKRWR